MIDMFVQNLIIMLVKYDWHIYGNVIDKYAKICQICFTNISIVFAKTFQTYSRNYVNHVFTSMSNTFAQTYASSFEINA